MGGTKDVIRGVAVVKSIRIGIHHWARWLNTTMTVGDTHSRPLSFLFEQTKACTTAQARIQAYRKTLTYCFFTLTTIYDHILHNKKYYLGMKESPYELSSHGLSAGGVVGRVEFFGGPCFSISPTEVQGRRCWR